MKKTWYYLRTSIVAVLLEIEGIWSLYDKTKHSLNFSNMNWIALIQIITVLLVIGYGAYKLRELENKTGLYEAIFLHSVYESNPTNRKSGGNMGSFVDNIKLDKLQDDKEEIPNVLLRIRPNLSHNEAKKIVEKFYDSQIKKLKEAQKRYNPDSNNPLS